GVSPFSEFPEAMVPPVAISRICFITEFSFLFRCVFSDARGRAVLFLSLYAIYPAQTRPFLTKRNG
ncbi:hypothetical protein RFZ44_07910, partial [Acinetobacter sp. 163]|nr:hypothetical protein [Acinetobacter sp. 163]